MIDNIRQPKRKAFLLAFSRCGHVGKAAEATGIDRSTHYLWMKDEKYRAAFAEAEGRASRELEDEAFHRATVGVCRPVLHCGAQVSIEVTGADGTVTKQPLWEYEKSDTLLIFLLKGLMPARFRERQQIEHTGPEKPLSLADLDREHADYLKSIGK